MEFRVEEAVPVSSRGDVREEPVAVEGIVRRVVRHNIPDNIRDIHRPPVVEKHRSKESSQLVQCLVREQGSMVLG